MGEKDIETRMAIVSVVVAITVVIANMISEETRSEERRVGKECA